MTLKKHLENQNGQSSVEYLVLFAIIAVLTLLSVTEYYPRLRGAGETYFKAAVNAMN